MARDESRRPLTDAEIERLREQRSEIRDHLEEQGVDVSGRARDEDAAEADPVVDQEPTDSD